MVTSPLECDHLKKSKIIRVSKKRQITIPLEYFEDLDLGAEVECSLENGSIVIRPLLRHVSDEFSVDILKELVAKGFSGDELIRQFKIEQANFRGAVRRMTEDVDQIAEGSIPSATFEDIFGSEN
ncbi:MAG: AbrB/MazE/SpoVT family DNA-binding domain-containing protein [Firmicutes bacterium]|nr:AbrB/MazE/SpoVT family DNA-binding domain-containing protein [Bacillota bacterium]